MILRSINSNTKKSIENKEDSKHAFLSKDQSNENKLPKDILFDDKEKEDATLIFEASNNNLSLFIPDMIFQNIVTNFKSARQLYGDTILRLLTGFDPNYIEQNLKIKEFRDLLKEKITKKIESLKKQGLLNENYEIKPEAYEQALIDLNLESLDSIKKDAFYFKKGLRKSRVGLIDDIVDFKGKNFRDLAIRNTIKKAIIRNHSTIFYEDLSAYERLSDNEIQTILAIDSSSSMKGSKIANTKKAALSLAYTSLKNRDSIGLIVFNDKIVFKLKPTRNFERIIKVLSKIRPYGMTNISLAIKQSILFFDKNVIKNLMIITDALPTYGKEPLDETYKAARLAKDRNVLLSIVGIDLNDNSLTIAKHIVEESHGTLYLVKNHEDINKFLIEEYYSLKSKKSFI